MQIQLNGEVQEVAEDSSLSELVHLLSLKPEQIAIELNREVIRRSEWANTTLRPEDKVEVVHFVGGGAKWPLGGGQGRSERI